MPFDATIAAFAAALADPALPPPAATRGPADRPDARRFAVYRNNVAVGLIGALEARYPAARKRVGAEAFRSLARAYQRRRKPATPVMIAYGADFPAFLDSLEPAGAFADLADLARVENAWVEAYHAAEATPFGLAGLAGLTLDALAAMRFRLHPATRLLRLATPAGSSWTELQPDGAAQAPAHRRPEDVLIVRPAADVAVRLLPPGGWAFADALEKGASVAEAAEAPGAVGDPGAHLVGLIEAGALAAPS